MRRSFVQSLMLMTLGASFLSGCGTSLQVTRYPAFWDYPGEYSSIAIAPTQGNYGYEVDDIIDNNVYDSGWYEYYDYNDAGAADLIVKPVVTNYSLEYDVDVDTHEETFRAEYADGYYVDQEFQVSTSTTTYEGWGKVEVQVYSAKKGAVIDTITTSDTCTESEHFEPNFPRHIYLHGGPGPNGEPPDMPREPVPPPPRMLPPERVHDIAVYHADRDVGNYGYLVNCAIREAARSASSYLYPVTKTITLKEKKVFRFFQNDDEVKNIDLDDGDQFIVVFALPDDASFNDFTVDVVAEDAEDVRLVSHDIRWDKATPQLQFTISASKLMEASGMKTKYSVRLWKEGKFVLERTFKLK